jgi:hypothetical protein
MRNLNSLAGSFVAIGVFLVSTSPSAMAKNPSGKKPEKALKSWTASVKVEGKGRYDSNTFLLSDRRKTSLQTAGADEKISGRFKDMNSVNDYIFTPSVKFLAEGPGVGGRKLGLQAGVNYEMYFLNPKRRHFNLEVAAEQNTSRNGRARAKFDYTPSYFYTNYLADATNYTSSVLPSERVYKPDVYSEWDVTLDYRYRLAGGKAALLGRVGYLQRRNQAPFTGHDRNEPHMGGGLDFGLTKWWGIGGNYDFALVHSPRVQEVMILNEPDFGVDFNNNGNTTDLSIRTVQFVDRRHHEQRLRANTKLGIREKSYIEFGYERRHRNFMSKEPFDVFHNGRTDSRNTFQVAFTSHLNDRLQFTTGYSYIFENSNRPNDPGIAGEINDYKRDGAFVSLSYRF